MVDYCLVNHDGLSIFSEFNVHIVTDVINEIGYDAVLYSASFPDHLRNKFHFSQVHGCMNATGQVQSK